MDPLFSAGLPNRKSGSGSQIGDQISMMDVGTFFNRGSEVWLRNNAFVSPSSAPQAAKIPYLQATGLQSGALSASLNANNFDIATDNAGRWVIAYGNSTNVQVSVDNGATWSLVAHNAGGQVSSVCYSEALGLFISSGNSTTAFFTSSVAAASVASPWTARTGSAITGGSANASSLVRASAAEVVMVCGSGTAGNSSRSTNGTSWTAGNLNVGLSSTHGQNFLYSLGGGIWICGYTATNANRATDGGATWSALALPVSGFQGAASGNGLNLLVKDSAIYKTTTGATGTYSIVGSLGSYAAFNSSWGSALSFDGKEFSLPVYNTQSSNGQKGYYARSKDGVNWKIKTAINRAWSDSSNSNIVMMRTDSSGNYVMAQTQTGTAVVYGNVNRTTGVGMNLCSSSTAITAAPTVQYVRIK